MCELCLIWRYWAWRITTYYKLTPPPEPHCAHDCNTWDVFLKCPELLAFWIAPKYNCFPQGRACGCQALAGTFCGVCGFRPSGSHSGRSSARVFVGPKFIHQVHHKGNILVGFLHRLRVIRFLKFSQYHGIIFRGAFPKCYLGCPIPQYRQNQVHSFTKPLIR